MDRHATLQLDLLRHGETRFGRCFLGRTDAELNARGWQQMRDGLAGRSPLQYQAIISSPLQRCAAFARDWADGAPLRIDTRLAEYDFGSWDGCTSAEIHARAPEQLERFWADPWHCPPPEAEVLPAFFERLERLLQELEREYQGPLLLICHGGVIRALRCILQGLPVQAMFDYEAEHGSLHRFSRHRS